MSNNGLFECRTNAVLNEIDMDITGVSGVAFGGPKHDILFVTVAGIILDLYAGQPMEVIANGTSLYTITGLDVKGPQSTSLKVPIDAS